MKHSVITLSHFYSSRALWLFCIQFQLQTREAELSGTMIKPHCLQRKKKKKERLQSTTGFNWMNGSKRQSFPTAEDCDMGQGNRRGLRQSLPLPWTSSAVHVPCVMQKISWENYSKIFWLWKWVARTTGSSYGCPAMLDSVDTLVYAHWCFSLKSFMRFHWIWNNRIQVNNNSFYT